MAGRIDTEMKSMTKGELVKLLAEFPDHMEVLLMSDPEGNDWHNLGDIGEDSDCKGKDCIILWPK